MSMEADGPIGGLMARVRRRWQSLRVLEAGVRAALGASAALAALAGLARWADRSPVVLAVLGVLVLPVLLAAVAWPFRRVWRGPSDAQLARFIEERVPALGDRLVTAIDVMSRGRASAKAEASANADPGGSLRSPLAAPMLADAAARAAALDLESIVPAAALRRSGLHALGAVFALAIVASMAIGPARQAADAASLVLFPSRVTLDVRPGNVRIESGKSLAIEARLAGIGARMPVEVQIADGDLWRSAAMVRVSDGSFRLALELVTTPFKYRVAAGSLISPTFAVTLARAPRVARIDLDYTYPAALSLKPRSEEDSGDIYAPGGSDVRVRIQTDGPVVNGRLTLGNGKTLALRTEGPTLLSGTMRIVEDNSYRVALADGEGLSSTGETEYFIRVLEDRPPEVHLTKPAGDRSVTRLEEIEIEAQADDDYGIDRLELVYSVRGAAERVVPLAVPRHATSVTARHLLYLEDLDIQPGDFVSYYVRARDLTKGTRMNEARSDMFFLDVKPFEQEFSLAQSQSMAGAGYSGAIDELVNGQRQVVVATWKIERRAATARGARSERDVRSIARTEADLRSRAERTASTFRESTMRDPRRRAPGSGTSSAGPVPPEEGAMAAAVAAMDRAVVALEALKTGDALPPEMDALNQLLKAQMEIKQRQVALNASAAGTGNANRNFDISTLFDQELRRQQQTNYETSKGVGKRPDSESGELDAIKDLARRQDELLRRQQDVARARMPDEERKRQLEQLTREQSALRQRAEELAQQMSGPPQPGQPSSSENARMRDISEDMRQAAGDLRRGAPVQAGSSASRALDKLRALEKRLQPSSPDDRRRALGEMQLEARQLADRQRQVASELARLEPGEAGKDAMRRLAGDEERLLERARQLEDRLKQVAGAPVAGKDADRNIDAARDVEQLRLSARMRQSADEMRAAAGGASTRGLPVPASGGPQAQAARQQDLAKQLDRLADRLAEGGRAKNEKDAAKDSESRRLSEQLARAQELREKLDRVARALETTGRQSRTTAAGSPEKAPGDRGRTGEGRQGAGGTDLTKLNEESLRQLREARDLIDQVRREDKSYSQNGAGFTFEGQGMILSAPGTEAFKQDFAKWDVLRQQAVLALERIESTLASRLQAAVSKDRLATGLDDVAPLEYQKQVDRYFKAIATRKP